MQDWQYDGDSTDQPFGSQRTRQELRRRLLEDELNPRDLLGGLLVNEHIKLAIMTIIGTRDQGVTVEEEEAEEGGGGGGVNKRLRAIEMLVGLLQRLRNRNIKNFFIVVLSLLALALNVPVTFWSILSAMGLLFSKTWTVELARELGDEVESRQVDGASTPNHCQMWRQVGGAEN